MVSPAHERPTLDKYEIAEEIGHGGMATVYRAHDRRLGRDVAVKVIHRHLRENKEVAARFVSEARAVAKLKHPSIVEVYDVSDEADDERYLVVELVPGTTLRKLLHERGHMPAEVAAAIGVEIGLALEHAHQQGVIHRDVKPENVLVDTTERVTSTRESQERPADAEAGRVKIADFGIAKLLDAQGVTSTGQVLGSPAHMAPEQIEGGDVSARADVFGLGVLLYEAMVGRLPFDGKNPAQVLRKVLDGTFTPPERARPTVGAGFSRIVEKALAREAQDRYPSAGELVEALRKELDTLGFESPRRELAEYLTSAEKYVEDYEGRVVGRLVDLGKKARTARQPPLAAAYFNRALAFRPDDAELLRQVAGLAQTERIKRIGIRGGAALGLAGVFALAAYGISSAVKPKLTVAPEVPVVQSFTPPPVLPPKSSLDVPAPPEKKTSPIVKVAPTAFPAGPDGSAAGGMRLVQVAVIGAKGGTVLIDGQARDVFGPPFELSVGSHTFEVKPPTKDCCNELGPVPKNVVAGEGVQTIRVDLPFRDAMLSFHGTDGSKASCPLLKLSLAPGNSVAVKIPGPDPERKDTCTITGPPEGTAPKSESIALRPGQSATLRWP